MKLLIVKNIKKMKELEKRIADLEGYVQSQLSIKKFGIKEVDGKLHILVRNPYEKHVHYERISPE